MSNLDVWAIQKYPDELNTAMNNINKGLSIIYSNCLTRFNIDGMNVGRLFNVMLYNEECDALVLLMKDGIATKDDMINCLGKHHLQYAEVSFADSVDCEINDEEIPELWFAREKYVLADAIKESIDKGITDCEYYPAEGNLSINYIDNNGIEQEIDSRSFLGVIKVSDKVILIINQKDCPMPERDIVEIITSLGMSCMRIPDAKKLCLSKK